MLLGFLLSAGTHAQDKPNILVIWGDDVGWFNTSAYNRGMGTQKTLDLPAQFEFP